MICLNMNHSNSKSSQAPNKLKLSTRTTFVIKHFLTQHPINFQTLIPGWKVKTFVCKLDYFLQGQHFWITLSFLKRYWRTLTGFLVHINKVIWQDWFLAFRFHILQENIIHTCTFICILKFCVFVKQFTLYYAFPFNFYLRLGLKMVNK
jgi:hypothetical protein